MIYLHVGAGAQAALSQAILFWLVAVRDMLCTGFQAEPEAGYGSQEETAMLSTANAVRFKNDGWKAGERRQEGKPQAGSVTRTSSFKAYRRRCRAAGAWPRRCAGYRRRPAGAPPWAAVRLPRAGCAADTGR